MKKYEFTGETREYEGKILHRIRALRDFENVKAGELGGWIEKESNLSHEGNCWVGDDAIVKDDAFVGYNAVVKGSVHIKDYVIVKDNTFVGYNAVIGGYVVLRGSTVIGKDGYITSYTDYLTIKKIENMHYHITLYRTNNNNINVADKYFTMTLDEFMEKVKKEHKDKKIIDYYKKSAKSIKMMCI